MVTFVQTLVLCLMVLALVRNKKKNRHQSSTAHENIAQQVLLSGEIIDLISLRRCVGEGTDTIF